MDAWVSEWKEKSIKYEMKAETKDTSFNEIKKVALNTEYCIYDS